MLKKERQMYILDRVEKDGRAITNDLVKELSVAEDTIRKDFQELSAKGLVKRIHGGVLRIEKKISAFDDRIIQYALIKQALAEKTLELINNKKVLYIDGGTTNLKLAECLAKNYTGTVITNSPAIALVLCANKNIGINLIGGQLENTTQIIKGTSAIKQIQEINIECCILGVSSLSLESGITFPSYEEAILKKEVINRSKQIIVIANKEKLETAATFFADDISVINILVTNEMNENILRNYSQKGIQIITQSIDLLK